MRASLWGLLIALFLLGSFPALAQDGLSPSDLEEILEKTDASDQILRLGNIVVGVGVVDEKILTFGVVLEIAAELEEYRGLEVADWFKENMEIELNKAELNGIAWVKTSLQNQPNKELYNSIEEALKELAAKPEEQPQPESQPQPGADLGQIVVLLQDFSQRLTELESRVASLSQPGEETSSTEELATLRQEVEALKEGLPDQMLLTELSDAPSRLADLEGEVDRLSRSLAGQRGLQIFLIILVILMLIWLVFLRVREISRA